VLAWLLCGAVAQAQPPTLPDPGRWQRANEAPATAPPLVAAPVGRRVQSADSKEAAAQDEEGVFYAQPPRRYLKTGAQISRPGTKVDEQDIDFAIHPELPGIIDLTRRLSEAQLFESIRQEARKRPGSGRIAFPVEPVIGTEPYAGRRFHQMVTTVEPAYICHKRLLFQQANFERFGWDVGAIQPSLHLLIFWYDMVFLPYHIWERPCQDFDCTAGRCLPGDPTPFRIPRERFSLSGLAAEIGTFFGGAFIIVR
jgi:hypothetical protein